MKTLASTRMAGWLPGAAALLAGCTVYAPMQPTVSSIRQAGQTELSASTQLNGCVEAAAVYSPLPHVLLADSTTYRPNLGGTTYFATRQWEVGTGTYWPLGKSWLLTGMGGYGYAATESVQNELLGNSPLLRARYSKLFGQVGIDNRFKRGSVGGVYRFTQLRFDELSFYSPYYQGTVNIAPMGRHEFLLYGRHELPLGEAHRWQLQFAAGLSVSSQHRVTDTETDAFETNRNLLPVLLASGGLVFIPTRGRPARPAGE